MAGFIGALIRHRRAAKKAGPDTSGRLKEIIEIIRKYDYEDGITPEIVVGVLQDLGPTFVKIGQIASQQAELIPHEYCAALSKLRSSVAPMDQETVLSQVEKHLGKPANEVFASFDSKPLGSASIGQVHKAELFDGTIVAVKVRRPGVVDTVARDFALLERILDLFLKDGIAGIDVRALVRELENTSKIELDFNNEAKHLKRFRKNNAERPGIEIPKCYRDYTNEAILTEDFVMGSEVSDEAYLDSLDDEERDRIAALVADNFATQVLVDGFYHADPHSGNVLIKKPVPAEPLDVEVQVADVQDNGAAANAIVEAPVEESADEHALKLPEHIVEWIDLGMMGTLSQQERQILIDLMTAIVLQDAYRLKRAVLKACQPEGDIDHGALLELCEDMCDQYNGASFGDFDLGDLMATCIASLQDASYHIDPYFTNLARGVIAVEGTVKAISLRINILNYFMDKVDIGANLGIDLSSLDEETLEGLNDPINREILKCLDGITRSSSKTADALDMLEKGQIRVRTDFSYEEKALVAIDRIVSYVVRAIMIVALFIGSCLLCMIPANAMEGTSLEQLVFPQVGFTGILLSLLLAILLVWSMRKSK